ncbi:hypothetical protein Tco_1039329 [Tanacetum coccineum]
MEEKWMRIEENNNGRKRISFYGICNFARWTSIFATLQDGQWVAAYRAAYSRMKSGMSMKDVELDAHKIYEGDGSKFLDLTVFNEVIKTVGGSVSNQRTAASEEGEYVVHSNQETPNSGGSTIQRPIGRDAAKKKGKGKASQSFSSAEFVEELRAMRITRESEIDVNEYRLEV